MVYCRIYFWVYRLLYTLLYSAKRWWHKTLANLHWQKNFGESPTLEINRPPDAMRQAWHKFLRISTNRGANVETTHKTLNLTYIVQRTATPQHVMPGHS